MSVIATERHIMPVAAITFLSFQKLWVMKGQSSSFHNKQQQAKSPDCIKITQEISFTWQRTRRLGAVKNWYVSSERLTIVWNDCQRASTNSKMINSEWCVWHDPTTPSDHLIILSPHVHLHIAHTTAHYKNIMGSPTLCNKKATTAIYAWFFQFNFLWHLQTNESQICATWCSFINNWITAIKILIF